MAQQAQQKQNDRFADYITVAERIELFYQDHPEGRIITSIVEHDAERGFILMRAEVYRRSDDALPSATGHAFEYRDAGFVQKTSYIEVCETSAAGRAIALLGYEIKKGIASREEMEKGDRMQSRSKPLAAVKPADQGADTGERNWHEEIGQLWKQLRAMGHQDFKTPELMMAHFKETVKRKQWAIRLLDIGKITDIPDPVARSYTGILTDIYEAKKEQTA